MENKDNRSNVRIILSSIVVVILVVLGGLYFFTDVFIMNDDNNGLPTNENVEDNQPSNNAVEEEDKLNNLNVNNVNDANKNVIDETEENDENINEEPEVFDIEAISEIIIEALNKKDMEALSMYVDEEKGLLFSPYLYVADDAVVFEQIEVATMLEADEQFDWGDYDGKGSAIELTPAEYFNEFIEMTAFNEPDDMLINIPQDRGNTLNNIDEAFPNGEVIEYYNEGSEEFAGIDWSSMLLVYEKDDTGILSLVAIIRDVWTV